MRYKGKQTCLRANVSYVADVPTRARRLPGRVGKAVAGIIRDELEAQGLTQAALGVLVDLSQAQVSAYLRGDRGMTVDEADDICRALGLVLAEVVAEAYGSS